MGLPQEDHDRERERVRALIRRRPDGLIVVPCRDHTRTLEDIVSLLAFDDCEWMTGLRPFLSAVRQPIEQLASEAWSVLKSRLDGKPIRCFRRELSCTLIVRESTSRVNSAPGLPGEPGSPPFAQA